MYKRARRYFNNVDADAAARRYNKNKRPRIGGIGHGQPGVFKGKLTRRLHKASFNSATKQGAIRERQYAGEFSMNDCHYIGCSSYKEDDAMHYMCIALLRKWYAQFAPSRQFFQSVDDTLRSDDADSNNRVSVQFVTADGSNQDLKTFDWATTPATSLSHAADQLRQEIIDQWLHGRVPWRMFTYIQFKDHSDLDATEFLGFMDLSRVKLHYTCKTMMNIQATTKSDDGSSLTTDITQNPLVGKLFYFKDKLPNVDPRRFNAGQDWGKYLSEHRLVAPYITPGTVGSTVSGTNAQPTGAWKSVPLATMFGNCIKEGPVSMDPSTIKRAMIRFSFHGRWEDWLKQFTRFDAANGSGVNDTDENFSFGTSMLLALEKRVRTGAAVVRLNAHWDTVDSAWITYVPAPRMQKETVVVAAAEPT